MKEIKEFIQELYDSATSGYTGMLVPLDAATRIVSEAFAAGMNFQDHEIKSKHKFRRFEKSDINKVADFKYIPNPANGGDDDYIIADMVFREYTYGEDGTEPRMTAPSNKEKFAIEDFAKSVTAAEFTYRGHSYIWFHHPGGWDGNDGIVHNPDCECNKK